MGGFNVVGSGCSQCKKMVIDANKIRLALIEKILFTDHQGDLEAA